MIGFGQGPTAYFSSNNATCCNTAVDFYDLSLPGSSPITSYFWDFGDGFSFSSSANPTYSYANSGTYYITLTVTDINGNSDSHTDTVMVICDSILSSNIPSTVTAGSSISFSITTVNTSPFSNYFWDFGDGTTSYISNPIHIYVNSGTYIINVVVDGCGGADSLSQSITVLPQQKTFIPDDNFEAYLEANGMGDGTAFNDSVYTSAIDSVSNLYVNSQNISDLTGIEDFTLLTSLNCQDNQIINLDLTNNYQLEFVACYNNQLNFLDINGLYALWNLDCGNNNLTYLDVNSNITLQEFSIYDNQITSLDLSNNIYLGLLAASNNQLLNIDVSNNIYLTELSIYANNITSLYIADNINLLDLKCDFNQLTNLDVSNNPNLTHLYCAGNQITNLDISQNADLTFLSCGTNPLTTLDLSNNLALTSLDCFNGHITNLDLSNNPALIYLICTNGQLQTLNLKNGNNYLMNTFFCLNNPNLSCINVDDEYWSTTNWIQIDSQHYFSNNCNGTTSIPEKYTNKDLLKVTDLLGRESKQTNQPLLYLYDDGTVEKRIVIE